MTRDGRIMKRKLEVIGNQSEVTVGQRRWRSKERMRRREQ